VFVCMCVYECMYVFVHKCVSEGLMFVPECVCVCVHVYECVYEGLMFMHERVCVSGCGRMQRESSEGVQSLQISNL
jgi:hypothetical protein